MDAENKLSDVNEMWKALQDGRNTEVYDFMKTMTSDDYPPFNDFAKEKGFKDFNEMVCFYTLGDESDDAPAKELRKNQRQLMEIALKHYIDKKADGKKTDSSSDFPSMLQSVLLPAAFAIVALVVWLWTQEMAILIIVAMALIWIAIQVGSSYQAGPGETRLFGLYEKYGVHHIGAQDAASKVVEETPEIKEAIEGPAPEPEQKEPAVEDQPSEE